VPSSQPVWLDQNTYDRKIQPLLSEQSNSALALALDVSIAYAADIRAGRRRPVHGEFQIAFKKLSLPLPSVTLLLHITPTPLSANFVIRHRQVRGLPGHTGREPRILRRARGLEPGAFPHDTIAIAETSNGQMSGRSHPARARFTSLAAMQMAGRSILRLAARSGLFQPAAVLRARSPVAKKSFGTRHGTDS
jgi:hypothetical protein